MRHNKHFRGFTLLELIVVIAIIGVLSVIILPSFQSSLARSRDASRLSDMANIEEALRTYNVYNGNFPLSPNEHSFCTTWDTSGSDDNGDGKPFITELVDAGLFTKVPTDPKDKSTATSSCKGYWYIRYPAGTFSCPVERGDYFVVGVADMETSVGAYPQSPGFKCSGLDFQVSSGMEWVTGGFQK